MKQAIWGTGLFASEFSYSIKRENIDFYIDNNKKMKEQSFLGKRVYTPDEIEDWSDIYIYIPYNFYDEIVRQLRQYGVNDESHFERYYEVNKFNVVEFKKDYEETLRILRKKAEQMKGFCLFWGRSWAFEDKGYREFLQRWKKNTIDLKLGLVSEAVWYYQEETEQKMNMPAIVTPGIFDDNIYLEGGKLEEDEIAFLRKKVYAYQGAECLKAQFPDLTEESALYMIYYMYQYATQVLEILHPKLIILYPLMMVQHRILEEVCRENGVPVISTHQGMLPGTLAFDIGGEVGKSLPAVYYKKFLKLPVGTGDLEQAEKVWDYLYRSKLNRKIQHKNNSIEYIMQKIDKAKPIVFYAGQNDINSNMVPYTEETQKYCSPIFKTSIDAGIYIAELCKKNKWNFVYKPHPMRIKYEEKSQLPNNTIYVENGNINDLVDISNVVVTILSQTNYISLVRHKPVVMLGYSQAKGKGCTYEAFEKDIIENVIRKALKNGFTEEQEKAFLIHIAQVLKYYLYDDLQEREIRFGRKVPCDIEEFYQLEKLLKESGGNP